MKTRVWLVEERGISGWVPAEPGAAFFRSNENAESVAQELTRLGYEPLVRVTEYVPKARKKGKRP